MNLYLYTSIVLLLGAVAAANEHGYLREERRIQEETTLHEQQPHSLWSHPNLGSSGQASSILIYGEVFENKQGTLSWMSDITIIAEKSGDGVVWQKQTSAGPFHWNISTNNEGTFRLRVIPKEGYGVVDTDSYALVPDGQGDKTKIHFNATGYSPTFQANAGDVIYASIKLAENTFTLKGHVWADLNENGVYDEGEYHYPRVKVTLSLRRGSKLVKVASAQTTSSGNYYMAIGTPYPGGNYTLSVSDLPPGYSGFTWRIAETYDSYDNDNDVDFDGKLKDFQIQPGQELKIDAGMVYGALSCVEGIVWKDDGDGIRRKYEDGRGLRYARVDLERYSGHPDSTTWTNSTGGYKICTVPEPRLELCRIHVHKESYEPTLKLAKDFSDGKRDSDIDDRGLTVPFFFPNRGDRYARKVDGGLIVSPTIPPPTSPPPPTPPPKFCDYAWRLIHVYFYGWQYSSETQWKYEVSVNGGTAVVFPTHGEPDTSSIDNSPRNEDGNSLVTSGRVDYGETAYLDLDVRSYNSETGASYVGSRSTIFNCNCGNAPFIKVNVDMDPYSTYDMIFTFQVETECS